MFTDRKSIDAFEPLQLGGVVKINSPARVRNFGGGRGKIPPARSEKLEGYEKSIPPPCWRGTYLEGEQLDSPPTWRGTNYIPPAYIGILEGQTQIPPPDVRVWWGS